MVVLPDTSIWIDHIRRSDAALVRVLESDAVVLHPFVLGEIALGRMVGLDVFLSRLQRLPTVVVAAANEVFDCIHRLKLSGTGIGYVDAHLLASTLLTADARLWTRDKKLKAIAERLSVAASVE